MSEMVWMVVRVLLYVMGGAVLLGVGIVVAFYIFFWASLVPVCPVCLKARHVRRHKNGTFECKKCGESWDEEVW